MRTEPVETTPRHLSPALSIVPLELVPDRRAEALARNRAVVGSALECHHRRSADVVNEQHERLAVLLSAAARCGP